MEGLEELVLHKFTVDRRSDGLCYAILKRRGPYLARCAKDIEEALNFGIKPKNPIFVRGKYSKFREMKMIEWG